MVETYSYIAGLIDGEGTITLTKDKKYRYPVVSVASTTYELVKFVYNVFGGIIVKKNKKLNYKTAYSWQCTRNTAINVLSKVKDFLKEPKKLKRANLILNEYKAVTPRNGKYSRELLNKKLKFEMDFFKL